MSDTATTTQTPETTTPTPTPTTTAIYLDPEPRRTVEAKWLGKHVGVKLHGDGADKMFFGKLALVSIDPDDFARMRAEVLLADETRRGFVYGTDAQIDGLTLDYLHAPRSEKWVLRNAGKSPRAARTGVVTRGTGATRGVNNSTKTLRMLSAAEVGQDVIDSINAVAAMLVDQNDIPLPGRRIIADPRDAAETFEPEDDYLDLLDASIDEQTDDPTPENTGYEFEGDIESDSEFFAPGGDYDEEAELNAHDGGDMTAEEVIAQMKEEAAAEEAQYEIDPDTFQGDPEEAQSAPAEDETVEAKPARKRGSKSRRS